MWISYTIYHLFPSCILDLTFCSLSWQLNRFKAYCFWIRWCCNTAWYLEQSLNSRQERKYQVLKGCTVFDQYGMCLIWKCTHFTISTLLLALDGINVGGYQKQKQCRSPWIQSVCAHKKNLQLTNSFTPDKKIQLKQKTNKYTDCSLKSAWWILSLCRTSPLTCCSNSSPKVPGGVGCHWKWS